MTLNWQDSLSIGVMEIDIQHKLLFDKFNQFLAACRENRGDEEVTKLFWFLEAYALTHFKDEERVMLELGYPDIVMHKHGHEAFVAEVQKLKERLKNEGPVPALLAEAASFISGWLLKHISEMDREVGHFSRL